MNYGDSLLDPQSLQIPNLRHRSCHEAVSPSPALDGDTEYRVRGDNRVARLACVVIPGIPHHVTQRGNGRQRTFFEDGDYALYLDLLAAAAERAQTEV